MESHGSVARAPAAKAGGPGLDFQWLPWVFFFFSSWLTNGDGMKDLWCSSIYSSAALNTDMNGKIYGAL